MLQSPKISLKTGPKPRTCADNLMVASEELVALSLLVAVVMGLELVCKALTKALAVFNLSKNKSC